MNRRLENGALAGLLVLTLVLVGFSLRSRDATSDAPPAAPRQSASGSPTASPSRPAAGGSVVFLGDSVAEGKSATAQNKRWTALVATHLGLTEVNLGHARTGYLRAGPDGSCGDRACPNFQNSVQAVVEAKPTTVVVSGGGNDTGMGEQEVAAAVSNTLTSLRAALPEATIYVVNPWWDLRPVPDDLAPLTETVQEASKKATATFLDTQQPLVGQPDLMVDGSTNPNDAGHSALARAVIASIGQTPSG
ncbi:hypothetical protein N802_15190 [Knoellia sinensis KCTC 19936]|uniref:SGNH hydrolase-type esterase domain-containing protein n=1 Tax=Knoellia sinensis KCTC 19936 TaxID=1385520 RepID=A0A0A0JCP8_9MICO|nr:SGNH/GDSL hydrolase family protein [Knoellia sinensis]KGN33411.1 hypothetical protein N802_15190 [Knoellia sinensis KCTC 19936]